VSVRSNCLPFAVVDPFEAFQAEVLASVQQWLEQFRPLAEAAARPTLQELSETLLRTRSELMGPCMQAVIELLYAPFFAETTTCCPLCNRSLSRKRLGAKTCSTLHGEFTLQRPYFYCATCDWGGHPLDLALGVAREHHQYDIQERAIRLAADLPYQPVAAHFEHLTGVAIGDHCLHATLNQVAERAVIEEVIPSTAVLEQRILQAREGHDAPPVLVVAIDGAHTPIRPAGRRAHKRGPGEWNETKGVRIYLATEDTRIVHLAAWHRTGDITRFASDLKRIARRLPAIDLPMVAVGDGAPWIWKLIDTTFPQARQVLDCYHCAEHIHTVAKAQYDGETAAEWAEATLARLHLGHVGTVIAALKRMQARSTEAATEIRKLIAYLDTNRLRVDYARCDADRLPKGSGAIESANKFIHHVRLKRSGAWWLKPNANHMLAIRCAIYNGTFPTVFAAHVGFYQQLLAA
jgi:hypothetical protein